MEQSSFSTTPLNESKNTLQSIFLPIAAVILSAVLSWAWFLPGVSAQLAPKADVASSNSTLDQVSEEDMAGALRTMTGSADFLGQFRSRKDACPVPLAWVSLVRPSGTAPEKVRIRSGNYYSPEFEPGDVPLRVAIPYPGPYEAGHGALEVISVGSGTTVALSPAWQVGTGSTKVAKQVVWDPIKRCSKANE
jgi:hypothetical protein